MRRIATLLGVAALAAVTAAPAHASTNAYVLYKTFSWPDACSSAGYAGEQNHQWTSYYCDTISPATWDAGGIYDLYVAY